jgi:hypothetical protein
MCSSLVCVLYVCVCFPFVSPPSPGCIEWLTTEQRQPSIISRRVRGRPPVCCGARHTVLSFLRDGLFRAACHASIAHVGYIHRIFVKYWRCLEHAPADAHQHIRGKTGRAAFCFPVIFCSAYLRVHTQNITWLHCIGGAAVRFQSGCGADG